MGEQALKKLLGERSRRRKGAVGGRELDEGSPRRTAVGREVVNRGESFQQKLLNNPVGQVETFLQTFFVDHVKQQFSVTNFCGSAWKFWRENPNC